MNDTWTAIATGTRNEKKKKGCSSPSIRRRCIRHVFDPSARKREAKLKLHDRHDDGGADGDVAKA